MEKAVEQRAVVTCRRFYHNCLKDPLTFEAFDAFAENEYMFVQVKYYIVFPMKGAWHQSDKQETPVTICLCPLCVWRGLATIPICLSPAYVFVSVCLPNPMSV